MNDQVTRFASIAEKKVCGVNFGKVTTGTPIVKGCSKTLAEGFLSAFAAAVEKNYPKLSQSQAEDI